ncbi:SDR family NAD(P)-dependent oxidoreductase [Hyphomonas sp.]|uniref:SDR family NAD(P)-dependent oxidoreductase n=1 Tax=Hyphomonas sp. TaxID=87 RepID=UPI0032EE3E0C
MSLGDVTGRLAGKVAIISGAGQTPGETIGNGKAMALLFARAGAGVLCVDRDGDRAAATVADIEQEGGVAALCVADVAKAEEAARIASDCTALFGRVDILVNNVGIGGHGDGPPHKLTEEAFDRILRVNLKGAWLVTQAVMPGMLEQRSGAIINISSLASIAGGFQMAYEVSKAGMNRMTRSVAMSGASRGVRCNAITPGLMDTPMAIGGIAAARGISEEALREERAANVPMKFMGTGWDTAHAALFLASDEARFITGAVLPVDGGGSARVG